MAQVMIQFPTSMKSKKAKDGSDSKAKVKIKSLKLTKESIRNLSDQDAGNVKGGGSRIGSGTA